MYTLCQSAECGSGQIQELIHFSLDSKALLNLVDELGLAGL